MIYSEKKLTPGIFTNSFIIKEMTVEEGVPLPTAKQASKKWENLKTKYKVKFIHNIHFLY